MTDRFCVQCSSYRREIGDVPRCGDEKATQPPTNYLVTGNASEQRPCQDVRSDRNACGRDALWFVESAGAPGPSNPIAAIVEDIRNGGPLARLIEGTYSITRRNRDA